MIDHWLDEKGRKAIPSPLLIESPDSGCWEWQGLRNRGGYGCASLHGRFIFLHRWAYEHVLGPIPPGLCVCHHCDNPPCMRPSHLFLGTRADNTRDAQRKGRFRGRHPGQGGAGNPCARLNTQQVLAIRELARRGVATQRRLAAWFGVCKSTVGSIVRGESWRE